MCFKEFESFFYVVYRNLKQESTFTNSVQIKLSYVLYKQKLKQNNKVYFY